MSIAYSYEIISVDQQARVMEVVYSSPGRQTMHISARLPFAGESLETIINMFSPVAYWREQEAEVVVPELGSGQIAEPVPPTPEQILAQWRATFQITMRQCRLHLLMTGKLDLVQPSIDALPEPTKTAANIEWEYGAVVQRSSPLIAQLAPVLGWSTPEEIDAQFTAASLL
jgi:hypothetical protein